MDEYVDILDALGNYTGEVLLKSEAHKNGLFHPTIHIWFYTEDGKLLIQKRAAQKDTFPGCWDVSVAGHIGAGEDIVTSAIREAEEELGIKVPVEELEKIGVHKYVSKHKEDLIDCEFNHVFICKLLIPLNELKLQKSEVDAVKLMGIDDFKSMISNPEASKEYVVLDKEYYQLVFDSIEKKTT